MYICVGSIHGLCRIGSGHIVLVLPGVWWIDQTEMVGMLNKALNELHQRVTDAAFRLWRTRFRTCIKEDGGHLLNFIHHQMVDTKEET